jgi:hypothetical protein
MQARFSGSLASVLQSASKIAAACFLLRAWPDPNKIYQKGYGLGLGGYSTLTLNDGSQELISLSVCFVNSSISHLDESLNYQFATSQPMLQLPQGCFLSLHKPVFFAKIKKRLKNADFFA